VSGTRGGALESFKLSYEAASQDQGGAMLTVRGRASDSPQPVPADQWSFVDGKSIKLKDKPKPGFLYEFTYEARNPKVQGLGFAATRDFVSWLKHDPKAVEITGRPITHALAIGFSQAEPLSPPSHHGRLQSRRAGPQGVRRHPQPHRGASDGCSSTCRSASRRAPIPSMKTIPSPKAGSPSRPRRSRIRSPSRRVRCCVATAATRC